MRSRNVCLFIVVSGVLCFPLAAPAADPPWIESSDRNSAIVIEMQGAFQPEYMSELGLDRFDAAVLDLHPQNAKRYDAAAGRVLGLLSARRKTEADPRVRQDLVEFRSPARYSRSTAPMSRAGAFTPRA